MISSRLHKWGESDKCMECGQAQTDATMDCPHREVTEEEKQKIKEKSLDYVDDRWRTYKSVYAY